MNLDIYELDESGMPLALQRVKDVELVAASRSRYVVGGEGGGGTV